MDIARRIIQDQFADGWDDGFVCRIGFKPFANEWHQIHFAQKRLDLGKREYAGLLLHATGVEGTQHSVMLTANPPRDVSLNLWLISSPVCFIAEMQASRVMM